MKRIKVTSGIQNNSALDEITVVPDVMPSDIPYFVTIENVVESTKIELKNIYISSNEKISPYNLDDIDLLIGKKSGKVYELVINAPISSKKFKDTLKKFIKENKTLSTVNSDNRKINNIKFTSDILKEAYKLVLLYPSDVYEK